MIQDIIFEQSEADNWFLRNKETIINKKIEQDFPYKVVKNIIDKASINSVLELGSLNGYRLNALRKILSNCKKFVGVDVSKIATEDGRNRYGLEMYCSKIDEFVSEKQFDLIIVNFVYHWIDRANIFKAISNTDNLLADGGYLIVGDFYPDFPQKRKYHHLENQEVYTYKTNYTNVFESLNTYKILYKEAFSHDMTEMNLSKTNSSNRALIALLRKDIYGYYHQT